MKYFFQSMGMMFCVQLHRVFHMITSSNGNIFRVAGPLCGEFTGHRWIPHTKARDAELWCFLWSAHLMNGWANNHEAGDLRRLRAHYDVMVMQCIYKVFFVDFQRCPFWNSTRNILSIYCKRMYFISKSNFTSAYTLVILSNFETPGVSL